MVFLCQNNVRPQFSNEPTLSCVEKSLRWSNLVSLSWEKTLLRTVVNPWEGSAGNTSHFCVYFPPPPLSKEVVKLYYCAEVVTNSSSSEKKQNKQLLWGKMRTRVEKKAFDFWPFRERKRVDPEPLITQKLRCNRVSCMLSGCKRNQKQMEAWQLLGFLLPPRVTNAHQTCSRGSL